MHIKIENIVERDDGSAIVTFDMDAQTMRHFVSFGILRALQEAVEEAEFLDVEED
jgi:hypothetical protein